MTRQKKLTMIFIFSLIFVIISTIILLSKILTNVETLFTEIKFQILLFLSFIGFFITLTSLHTIIIDIDKEIDSRADKEKNIKDYYLYSQLIDPPVLNN